MNDKSVRVNQMFDPVEPTNLPDIYHVSVYSPDPRERFQMFDPVEPIVGGAKCSTVTQQDVSYLKNLIGRVGSEEVQRILNGLLK